MVMALHQALRRVASMSSYPFAAPISQTIAGMSDCENVATRLWHRGFADGPALGTSDTDVELAEAEGAAEEPVAEKGWRPLSRKGRKPTRAEKGTYIGNQAFLRELEGNSLTVPEGVPIYDLQTDIPWFFENHTPWTDLVKRTLETDPELVQLLMSPEQPIPYPEAKSILRWETNMILQVGPDNLEHPLNKKVRLMVYLRDLQEEAGLTDEALQHIALVCGPRYNPKKGEITLTSETYPDREQNRRELLDMVHALIAEGRRKHPNTDPAIMQQQKERKAGRENLPPMPVPEFNPLKKLQKQQGPDTEIRAAMSNEGQSQGLGQP